MRTLVIVIVLALVGMRSTEALAKDVVLVKLRDDAPAPHAAAKPAPKKSTTRTSKRKPPARKTVAKSKPKAKKKSSSSKSKSEPKSEQTRLRPMP